MSQVKRFECRFESSQEWTEVADLTALQAASRFVELSERGLGEKPVAMGRCQMPVRVRLRGDRSDGADYVVSGHLIPRYTARLR